MILSYFSHRRRKAPSTFTPVRRKPKIDFSVTGLVFCSMMMFMGVAAMNTQANLLFGVFGLMIGVLLVSWGISHLVLRRLNVQRVAPDAAIVGQPATVTYAGWVGDSVAGLYQINATVPTAATSGNAISVVVSVGTAKSQAGVTMAIQ